MYAENDSTLAEFAEENQLHGLSDNLLQAVLHGRTGCTLDRARAFLKFSRRIDNELLNHPIIRANAYSAWFKLGRQNVQQLRAFIVQFSVFSNLFLIAQLHKVINADSLEGMRASKEILANEIGVVFKRRDRAPAGNSGAADPTLLATVGSVEGGTFRFQAAHFEWLLKIAAQLDLAYADLGKRRHGSTATLHFCDELVRLYGSENYTQSQAASFAVENWAAAGFWKELITGFELYNQGNGQKLPLSFFTWHDRLEAQHAQHTQEELEEIYFTRELDEDGFIRDGNEMLHAVGVFWDGLDSQRQLLERPATVGAAVAQAGQRTLAMEGQVYPQPS